MFRYFLLLLFFIPGTWLAYAQQPDADSLQNLLLTASTRDKALVYYQLGQVWRDNDPAKAIDYTQNAVEFARQTDQTDLLAKSEQQLGLIYFRNGSFVKARESYLLASKYFQQLNNDKGKADVDAALGAVFLGQGNLSASLEKYLDALRYYENVNDRQGQLNVFNALGNIYTRQNNFTKAIEYNLKAITIYERSSDKFRTLVGYDNIGNIYIRQGNYRQAGYYFNKSLILYKELNNTAGVAFTTHQLGNIALKSDNTQQAISYYTSSLRMAEQLKTQPLIVSNCNGLAEAYTALKEYEKAIALYKRAVSIAQKVGMNIELETAYEGLSKVYKLTENTDRARTYTALSTQIKDSLYNDSTIKKLADLQLLFESEKKQKQIELLSKEQQIKESDLLRERQLRIFLISLITLMALLIAVFGYLYTQNKKITKRLEQQNKDLEHKTTEILEKKEELGQLNSVKDRFFSIISHDLRNNLTTMKLYFDLVSHADYKPGDHQELTIQISSSVQNTIDLLENLLIWASTQIKGIPLHIQKLHLHTLAEENISLVNAQAMQKEVKLFNNIEEDVTAFGDIDMISLVLRNLITNAVKFTAAGGRIIVSAEIQNGFIYTSVTDTGVGIGRETLENMFTQNANPTTKGTANEKGTGLGLLLCKDFVERNGGTITVKSKEGEGSTFTFSLPLQMPN